MTVAQTAIVVLGSGGNHLRRRTISDACRGLVRAAERLVEHGVGDVVVLTGGAREGRSTEAEQMRTAWSGPDVELVLEPTAATTAENAARTLPLLLEHGIERAVVVCAPLHYYRARFFFSRLYAPHGIEVLFETAAVAQGPRAFAWEIGAAAVCRRQLRAAQAELVRKGYA